MKPAFRIFLTLFLIFNLLFFTLPESKACGPSYLIPVFDYERAPENPYINFAKGKIGIIKPTYPRIVLFAAYRHLNGGAFSAEEQNGLVEAWDAYFNNKDFKDRNITEAVREWIKIRKTVMKDEKKPPQIYVERNYIGYNFFPNCTKNAFEVAKETLEKRIFEHGVDNKLVKNWVLAQDDVFQNCASGKRIPSEANSSMPVWLQKDRKYQIAAAEFYSLGFKKAKQYFTEISQDSDSLWQEVSKYLVGRTLIRQASLSRSPQIANTLYIEAEQNLQSVYSEGGKYSNAADGLIGLIKYRTRPEERVIELSQNLANYGGENFRQSLIDYTWLLEKFENKTLKAEQKRIDSLKKQEENYKDSGAREIKDGDVKSADEKAGRIIQDGIDAIKIDRSSQRIFSDTSSITENDKEYLVIRFYIDDYSQNWTIKVPIEATEQEVFAEAEKVAGKITEKMKEKIRETKSSAYLSRFNRNSNLSRDTGYYGDLETSIDILPDFIKFDDLSSWLFIFQMTDERAYVYSLNKYEQTNSDLWLATAISKANKNSKDIETLLKAAENFDNQSNAFPMIGYHRARILLDQGKKSDVLQQVDEILQSSLEMPISTRNKFLQIRMELSENLDDFLKHSLRRPFAFDQDGYSTTIKEIIAERKSYYDPKYIKKSRIEYEREINEEFADVLNIQNEPMLDYHTSDIINQNFPTKLLLQIQKSKHLPVYLKKRLAKAIWTRSVLLEDFKTADNIFTEIVSEDEKDKTLFTNYKNSKTKQEKITAALLLILKNERFTPYLTNGIGPPNETYSGGTRWWCTVDDEVWDSNLKSMVKRNVYTPSFISKEQKNSAQKELKKLNEMGNASNYLTQKVFEWANKNPRDRRVEESLFIVYEANDWDKYGCGGNYERRQKIGNFMKKRYPKSPWTQKILQEEN